MTTENWSEPDAYVRSLQAEVRALRRELDALRDAVREATRNVDAANAGLQRAMQTGGQR